MNRVGENHSNRCSAGVALDIGLASDAPAGVYLEKIHLLFLLVVGGMLLVKPHCELFIESPISSSLPGCD